MCVFGNGGDAWVRRMLFSIGPQLPLRFQLLHPPQCHVPVYSVWQTLQFSPFFRHISPFLSILACCPQIIYYFIGASLVAQMVKNLLAIQETGVPSLGWEDSLEKEMATHSSKHSCLGNSRDRGA